MIVVEVFLTLAFMIVAGFLVLCILACTQAEAHEQEEITFYSRRRTKRA